jgi:hypothetical protein
MQSAIRRWTCWGASALVAGVAVWSLAGAQAQAAGSKWMPTPLTAKQKKIFFGSPQDHLTKRVCTGRARVTTQCRDKSHYIASNEYYHQMYRPFIEGVGGGHIGVGTEQNFTFIAWSRSRFAWLMDYDPVVVRVNLVHRALILMSKNRREYANRFMAGANIRRTVRLLKKFYKSHPERDGIIDAYRYARRRIGWQNHLFKKRRWNWNYHRSRPLKRHERLPFKDNRDFAWMHKEEWYQYIRKMFQTNRIRVMKGDLLLNKSLMGIGNTAKKLGVVIHSLYTSNAEEFWKYPKQFRKNVRNLPMDKRSVLLRTRFSSKYGPRLDAWIYIIQGGLDFQKRLGTPGYNHVDDMMKGHKKLFHGVYSLRAPKPMSSVAP